MHYLQLLPRESMTDRKTLIEIAQRTIDEMSWGALDLSEHLQMRYFINFGDLQGRTSETVRLSAIKTAQGIKGRTERKTSQGGMHEPRLEAQQ